MLRVSPRQRTRDVKRGNKIDLAVPNALKMGHTRKCLCFMLGRWLSKEKHLWHKHKDLSSNPQNPCANPDTIVHDYKSITWGREVGQTGGFVEPSSSSVRTSVSRE